MIELFKTSNLINLIIEHQIYILAKNGLIEFSFNFFYIIIIITWYRFIINNWLNFNFD